VGRNDVYWRPAPIERVKWHRGRHGGKRRKELTPRRSCSPD
jgi:hypothetical protein